MKNMNTGKRNRASVKTAVDMIFRVVVVLCLYLMYSRVIPFGTIGFLYALTGGVMTVCIGLLMTDVPDVPYAWDEIKNKLLLILVKTVLVFGVGAIVGWLYGYMPEIGLGLPY